MRLMCAIKTPYLADGSIDLVAYDKHAEHLISNGVEALIIGGTTGEGHLFSWEEHLVLIAHTKAIFGDRVCVVGNTGSNHTGESIEATKKGFAVGMDCALLINPYYGKTSARGMLMHINAAMGFGPAIIYNVPSRTGQDLTPEILTNTSWMGEALSNHPNFAGVKECLDLSESRFYQIWECSCGLAMTTCATKRGMNVVHRVSSPSQPMLSPAFSLSS